MHYFSVARVFILSVYTVGLLHSSSELERVKKRIKHLETRLNTESAFRNEDILEITERLDDIDIVLNATIVEKQQSVALLATETSNPKSGTVDTFKEDLNRLSAAFREEKYEAVRFRREIPRIESKLTSINEDVENYCKVSLNKTDQLLGKFKSFENFVEDSEIESRHEREKLQDIAEQVKVNTENERNMSKQIENIEKLIATLTKQIENIVKPATKQSSHVLQLYSSCQHVKDNGIYESGIYHLRQGGEVYCDQTTDGGGWIVFQRRMNGGVDFYRNWTEYKRGFGDVNGEFWLGNDIIHNLTAYGRHELRIDMEDFDGNTAYAMYARFKIHPEKKFYRLKVSGYSGTAGDSLKYHNGMMFSTFDRDNDHISGSCAEKMHGAWWYKYCHHSNLNGRYYNEPGKEDPAGISWYDLKLSHYSLKKVEMKFR